MITYLLTVNIARFNVMKAPFRNPSEKIWNTVLLYFYCNVSMFSTI